MTTAGIRTVSTPVITETSLDLGQALTLDSGGAIAFPFGTTAASSSAENSLASLFNNATEFSILGWIKPANVGTEGSIISRDFVSSGGGVVFAVVEIGTTADGNLSIGLTTQGDVSPQVVELGNGELASDTWHNVGITFDAGTVTAVINGSEYSATIDGTSIRSSGGAAFTLAEGFDGQIGELSFWQEALSATEIQNVFYQDSLTGDEENLTAYYTFNEGTGFSVNASSNVSILDQTGNGNDGRLTGADETAFVDAEAPTFLGYVEVKLTEPVEEELGLILRYDITTDGIQAVSEDFYNSQIDISTTSLPAPFDGVFIPQGEDTARIYVAAREDAIVEADGTVEIQLLDYDETVQAPFAPYTLNTFTLEVGTQTLTENDGFTEIGLDNTFDANPVVISQIQTFNGTDFLNTRQRNTDLDSVEIKLEGTEDDADTVDTANDELEQSVGYLAIEAFEGFWNGQKFIARTTDPVITDEPSTVEFGIFDNTPRFFGSIASFSGTDIDGGESDPATLGYENLNAESINLTLQEDTFLDLETTHTAESVNFLAIEQDSGLLTDINGNLIGEFGPLPLNTSRSGTILFENTYDNPVIFSNPVNNRSGVLAEPTANARVELLGDGSGFEFFVDEPEGARTTVSRPLNYLVLESGVHTFASTNTSIDLLESLAFEAGVAIANVFGEDATEVNLVPDDNGDLSFQLKLTSEPTDTVTLSLVLTGADGTLSEETLEFDSSNWDVYQAIALSDLAITDPASASISLSFDSTDTNYDSEATPDLATVLNLDETSDVIKLRVVEGGTPVQLDPIVSLLATADTQEGNSIPGTFTVSLDAPAPDDGLRVFYQIDDPSLLGEDYLLGDDSTDETTGFRFIDIAPGATQGTLVIDAIDDNRAESEDVEVSITLLDDPSGNYTVNTDLQTDSVAVIDNDQPAIEVARIVHTIDGSNDPLNLFSFDVTSYTVTETGADIILTVQPTESSTQSATQPFSLTLSDGNGAATETISFTAEADGTIDNTPQEVTLSLVTGEDGGLAIAAVTDTNSDPLYSDVSLSLPVVQLGIPIQAGTPLVLSEDGEDLTFGVRLQSIPQTDSDIPLDLTISDVDEASFDDGSQFSSLSFNQDNWDTYQLVTVQGLDDGVEDGNQRFNISISVDNESTLDYRASDVFIPVINQEPGTTEDVDAITFIETPFIASVDQSTIAVTEGGTLQATIVLNQAAPTGGLTVEYLVRAVTADASDLTDGTVLDDLQTLDFAEGELSQTIEFGTTTDLIDEDSESLEIILGATNTDQATTTNTYRTTVDLVTASAFDSSSSDINLQISSNETDQTLTLIAGTALNFGNGQIVIVESDTEINQTTGTLVPITLPERGLTSDSLVAITNFSLAENTETSISEFINSDGLTLGASAALTILDGSDNAGIQITSVGDDSDLIEVNPTDPDTPTTRTFEVVLTSQPTETVFAYIGSTDSSEGLLSDEDGETNVGFVELIFTPNNWDVPQTVTVTGIDDNVDDGDITFNVLTSLVSNDYKYNDDRVSVAIAEDSETGNGTVNLIIDELNIIETVIKADEELTFSNGAVVRVTEDTAILNSEGTAVPVEFINAPTEDIPAGTLGTGTTAAGIAFEITPLGDISNSSTTTVQFEEETIGAAIIPRDTDIRFTNGTVVNPDLAFAGPEDPINAGTLGVILLNNELIEVETTAQFRAFDDTIELALLAGTTQTVTLDEEVTLILENGGVFELEVDTPITLTPGTSSSLSPVFNEFSIGLVEAFETPVSFAFDGTTLAAGATSSFVEELGTSLEFTNVDDDEAAVIVDVFDGELATAEGQANNFFTVVLNSQPTDDVEVTIIPSDDNIQLDDEFDGEAITLTFDETNWNVARTVEVTAIDDTFVEFDHTSTIRFDIDAGENETVYSDPTLVSAPDDIQVFIEDNDVPTARVISVAGALEANQPGYFIIALDEPLPGNFDDTGLEIQYTVAGTVDADPTPLDLDDGVQETTDGTTDDLQPIADEIVEDTITGTVRIAPGERFSPLIAFPIDDFKVEAIPLVAKGFTDFETPASLAIDLGNLNEALLTTLLENDGITIDSGSELIFSSGTIATTASGDGLTIQESQTLFFDGDDDYVGVANLTDFPTTAVTVEGYFKRSQNEESALFSYAAEGGSDNELLLLESSVGDLQIFIGNNFIQTDVQIPDEDWHHWALTWQSSDGQVVLYRDGQSVYTDTVAQGDALVSGGTFVLGQEQDSVGGGFNAAQSYTGSVDDVRLWNTARSEAEIRAAINGDVTDTNNELVARYAFEQDPSLTIIDSSGNGNNGSYLNAGLTPLIEADTFESFSSALDLDGTDDTIQIASGDGGFADFGGSNFTVELLFKTEDANGTLVETLNAGGGDFWGISIVDGFAQFDFNNGGNTRIPAESTTRVDDGEWHHLAAVRTGSQAGLLYIDGVEVSEVEFTAGGNTAINTNGDVFVGSSNQSDFLSGAIDEVRIWNDARTANEIQSNFLQSLDGTEANLQSYFTFDADSGTSIIDQSGNGNEGTLIGADITLDGSLVTSVETSDAVFSDELIASIGFVDLSLNDNSPSSEIASGDTALLREESVVVTLDDEFSEDYQVSSDAGSAVLKIEDNDRAGIRIVEVGDSTTVTEGDPTGTEFFVSLLSEPELGATVSVILNTAATSTAPILIQSLDSTTNTLSLEVQEPDVQTLLLPSGTYSFDGVDVTISEDVLLSSAPPLEVASANIGTDSGSVTLSFNPDLTNDTEYRLTEGMELQFSNNIRVRVDTNTTIDSSANQTIAVTVLENPDGAILDNTATLINPTDVTVASTAGLEAGDIADYNYTELQFENGTNNTTLEFNSDNWFELQSVVVEGVDDAVVETGEFHTGLINYEVSALDDDGNLTDPFYNGLEVEPQVVNIRDRVFDAQETAESISEGFLALQDGLENITLPIIGEFGDVAPSFIDNFLGTLADEIRATDNLTPDSLTDAINISLEESIDFEVLTVEITELSTEEISLFIELSDSFTESVGLSSDLGLPALNLGLETRGNLVLDTEYTAGLGFGINKEDGFFLDTEATQFEVGASLGFDEDFVATGNLGFIQIDAANAVDPSDETAEFTVVSDFDEDAGEIGLFFEDDERTTFLLEADTEIVFDNGAILIVTEAVEVETSADETTVAVELSEDSEATEVAADATGVVGDVDGTGIAASVQVGFEQPGSIPDADGDDSRLTLSELSNARNVDNIFDFINYEVVGDAFLDLDIATTIEGNEAFPSFNFNLFSDLELFNYGNEAEAGSTEIALDFNDLTLDLGGFITDLVEPIIGGINDAIDPISPVIEALTTEIELLESIGLASLFDQNDDGAATVLEVAGTLADTFGDGRFKAVEFIDAVAGVIELTETLAELNEQIQDGDTLDINFGSYSLELFGASESDANDASEATVPEAGADELGGDSLDDTLDQSTGNSNKNRLSRVFGKLDDLGVTLDIVDDPLNVVKFLLGQDIDLVTWDVPELDISFGLDYNFPIVTGISGNLFGEFSAFSDLVFGFDTVGLTAWQEADFAPELSYLIFDGFFLNDLDPDTGEEVDELSVDATVGVGVSLDALVASATARGGVQGIVGLDLVDIGEFEGTSDGRIRGSEIISRLNTPLELFALNGAIDVFLEFVVKVFGATVFDEELARFTLFEFSIGGGGSGAASGSYIANSTIFFDANFNGILDEDEPFTTTDSYGRYFLELPIDLDGNNDNVIDKQDGVLVSIGGTDSSSGLDAGVLRALPGSSIISPLTSLQAEIYQLGLTQEEAASLVQNQLGLETTFALELFDPLEAVGDGSTIGLETYIAHIEVQALLTQARAFLDGLQTADPNTEVDPNNLQAVLATTAQLLLDNEEAGTTFDLTDSTQVEGLLETLATDSDLSPSDEQVGAIADIFTESIEFLNTVAEEGIDPDNPASSLPLLAAIKRVVQGDIPTLAQEVGEGTTDRDTANTTATDLFAEDLLLVDETLNILENRTVSVASSVSSLDESDTTTVVEFTLTLSEPAPNQGLTLVYGVVGTAISGEDYELDVPNAGTIYIEPDSQTATVQLTVIDDAIAEGTESVTFTIQSVGEGFTVDAAAQSATVQILDDETTDIPVAPEELNLILGTINDDDLVGTDAADEIRAGLGNDTVDGLSGSDRLVGSFGDDSIIGGADNDVAQGIFGDDELTGDAGNDALFGGAGDDTGLGGTENDLVDGGAGSDTLSGDAGDDRVIGGADNDLLQGNDGNDVLEGRSGLDILIGGAGTDILRGGTEADQFVFASFEEGFDIITDLNPEEGDKVVILESGFGDGITVDDFSLINGILKFGDENLAILQNQNQTYAFVPDLSEVLEIVTEIPDVPTDTPDLLGETTFVTTDRPDVDVVDLSQDLLTQVLERGYVRVAVSEATSDYGQDLALGLSAALFGDANAVEFVTLEADNIATAIAEGSVDISFNLTPRNIDEDLNQSIDFGPAVLFDSDSGEALSPSYAENQSAWANVVRWVSQVPAQAEALGIYSHNLDRILESTNDARVQEFLGLSGELGESLGLPDDFAAQTIQAIGNTEELLSRSDALENCDRNHLWTNDGLQYSAPFDGGGIAFDLTDNRDRNVLEEIIARGTLNFGITLNDAGLATKSATGDYSGFEVDLAQALSVALFGDADQITFVEQTADDSFANTANGVVDISAGALTQNLIRDAVLGVDYSPTYLYSDYAALVKTNSGIQTLNNLSGLRIGFLASDTEAQEALQAELGQLGLGFTPVAYESIAELLTAYESDEVDVAAGLRPQLAGAIAGFDTPENHRLLNESIAEAPLGLIVDEDQSEWLGVVRWVTSVLVQAEELGLSSDNIDQVLADNTDTSDTNDSESAVREFLGLTENVGEGLGLADDFAVQVIRAVGNYGELYERHFDTALLPRDNNLLAENFGLQVSIPLSTEPLDEDPDPTDESRLVGSNDADSLTGSDIDNVIQGLQGNDELDGQGGRDRILGGSGNDVLVGDEGNDILIGESGRDTLLGGEGSDRFRFKNILHGTDTILDFTPGEDTIDFIRSSLGNTLSTGSLASKYFTQGINASDATDRFIFNPKIKTLFFDEDGVGGTAKRRIAVFESTVALTNSDIRII